MSLKEEKRRLAAREKMTDKMNSEIKDGRKEKPADNDNNIAGIASTAGVESEPDRETEEDEEYEEY